MADKLTRYFRTIPNIYNPQNNIEVNALLEAWAESDETISSTEIPATRDQLFVATGVGKYLDFLASNVGTKRPSFVALDNPTFRDFIVTMSYTPKQIRKTMYELLDVFWGPLYSRANVTSVNAGPYNLGAPVGLSGALSFENGSASVDGVGTFFTAEITVGDFIKLDVDGNTEFASVVKITNDTTLVLTSLYSGTTGSGTAKAYTPKTLDIEVDRVVDEIIFSPIYFVDTTVATAAEVVATINAAETEMTGEEITSIFTLDNFVNIRTNAVGPLGRIKITGGDANAILGFSTTTNTIDTLDAATVIYEINMGEIVVKVPELVARLVRTLKGSAHLRNLITGTVTIVDNILKTLTVDLSEAVLLDELAGQDFAQGDVTYTIVSNTAGTTGVVLTFGAGTDLSLVNAINTDFQVESSGGALTNWVINHLASQQYLNVSLYDLATNEVVIADTFSATDANNTTASVSVATDFKAAINKGTVFTQGASGSTWNIAHNLGEKFVIIDVYDASDERIVPDTITAIDANNIQLDFSTAQSGNVVISCGNAFEQTIASTTWNIAHNLESSFPVITVYDATNEVVIPDSIKIISSSTIRVEFSTAQSGTAVYTGETGDAEFAITNPLFPSSYIYATNRPYLITSVRAKLKQEIVAGKNYASIDISDSSDIPSQVGWLIFGFGTESEEHPIPYLARPNNSSLKLDSSYIFEKRHEENDVINVLAQVEPYDPRDNGQDYAVYFTGVRAALEEFQSIMDLVKAMGINIRWDIKRPSYPFYGNYVDV